MKREINLQAIADEIKAAQDAVPIQSDDLVTMGTLTAAFPIHSGQTWSTNLNGIALSGISVSFEE